MKLKMDAFSSRAFAEINASGYKNLIEAFLKACKDHANEDAFICMGSALSFRDLDLMSEKVSRFLSDKSGLNPGDRVVVQLPNIMQFPIVAWGVLRAGMVLVNANPLYTNREVKHIIADSGAKAMVAIEEVSEQLYPAIEGSSVTQLITTKFFDMNDHAALPPLAGVEISPLSQILGEEYAAPDVALEQSFDDLAMIQYTGGTTGEPKGAMLTQGNIYASAELSASVLEEDAERDIVIAPMPLYHIYGFSVNVVGLALRGGCSVLVPDPRNTDDRVNTMSSHRFASFAGVNTIFVSLLDHPEFKNVDFSACKGVIAGGAALVPDVAQRWKAITGVDIYEGYGLTETCAALSCNSPSSRKLGTVGHPLPWQEVKIVNLDGDALPVGEEGEVLVRGPHVMMGYWKNEKATKACLDDDGWLSTGDIGLIEPDGHLKIVDRLKDMVLVSGFNVYPNEVEAVLYEHEGIAEAAVIGVKDEKTGEAVKAFVTLNNPSLSESEIRDYCRGKLAAYKVPKFVEVCDDLPKSNVGKILRKALRS